MKFAFRHVPFSPSQIDELEKLAASADCQTIWYPDDVKPDLETLRECEVLMGYFPPDIMKSLPLLKWVQTPAAGVERLCGDIYAGRDVVLTNCSGAFGIAISEYMLTGLLMLMRHMPAYLKNQMAHSWKDAGVCRSIYGSTVTVVGMGDIGTNFAKRAKALGAHVRGVRRTLGEAPAYFDEVFTSDHICEAVENVDAVIMSLPGTKATENLVSAECIARMSPQTIIVNSGRGLTLDEQALISALQEGRIAGAVLDVATVEPLPTDSPLWDMENVIITPHISGHDNDPINIDSIFSIFKENMGRYLNHQSLLNMVDRGRGY